MAACRRRSLQSPPPDPAGGARDRCAGAAENGRRRAAGTEAAGRCERRGMGEGEQRGVASVGGNWEEGIELIEERERLVYERIVSFFLM